MEFLTDSNPIRRWEETPNGLKLWISFSDIKHPLNYDDTVHVIDEDELFDKESLNSAVGLPLTINHPPCAVNIDNRKHFGVGTLLQEYSNQDGTLVMAGLIHDSKAIAGIKNAEILHTSAAYNADKELIKDGYFKQKKRRYNHVALLDSNYQPRAGKNCKLILDSTYTPPDEKQEKLMSLDSLDKASKAELNKRIELLVEFQDALKKHNIYCDANNSSHEIKKKIISIYYPEKVVRDLTNDYLIDGFFINFKASNHDKSSKSDDELDSFFEDSSSSRQKFISQICGK